MTIQPLRFRRPRKRPQSAQSFRCQHLEPRHCLSAPSPSDASAQASLEHLREVMDQNNARFPVYDDVSSAGDHFFAYAKIPDQNAPVAMNGSWTANPHSGATAIRTELDTTGGLFGGYYFQNGTLTDNQTAPVANFGNVANAGIDLTGATALTFWARGEAGGEHVDFFMGGVGRDPTTGAATAPYPDSTPVAKIAVTLTTDWQQYRINLTGRDLSYVLGGFGWAASVSGNPDSSRNNPNGAVFYLDDIQYELSPAAQQQRLNEPRFLTSYETAPNQGLQPPVNDFDLRFRNSAFTYDNAVALLAFLSDGSSDSVRRARLIGDAFVYAAHNDRTFRDGGVRLRSDYTGGDISLPPGWTPHELAGTVPAPGFYEETPQTFVDLWSQGDDISAIDTGNNAWVMLALLGLYNTTKDSDYLTTASDIGQYIQDNFRSDQGIYQGFLGGVDRAELPTAHKRGWASTEHNIDLFAAYSELYRFTGAAHWQNDANHARQFVDAMWDDARHCYLTGTVDSSTRNETANQLPLDVQAWSTLAIPNVIDQHPDIFRSAEQNQRTTADGFSGFDFNNDKDGVWFEGTAQMATAYAFTGNTDAANSLLATLQAAQHTQPFGNGNGIAAASHDGVSTGFTTPFGDPIYYFRRIHIGATAWNMFAQEEFNPFNQVRFPQPPPSERFVTALYFDILGRSVEPTALAFWRDQLTEGQSRGSVVDAVDHGAEYFGSIVIAPAYQQFLGRAPDSAGLAFWIDQMQHHHVTDEQLEADFISSPEFYQHAGGTDVLWVDALYQSLLRRSADSSGEAYWAQQLSQGVRRADIAYGFSASEERETERIAFDYMHFLHRAPDAAGIDYWLKQFAHGVTNEELITGFVASDEYFQQHTA